MGEALLDRRVVRARRDEIPAQDVFLFDGSARDNIAYGRRDATDAEIEDAARRANAHEFIEKLPEGYQTFVGERGVKLSGGQQQRLAIAQALILHPKILLLDEPFGALDPGIRNDMHELITRLWRETGMTVFMVTHDIEIVDSGTHRSTLSRRASDHLPIWAQLMPARA